MRHNLFGCSCLLKGGDIVVMSLTNIDGLMDILIGTSLRLKRMGQPSCRTKVAAPYKVAHF